MLLLTVAVLFVLCFILILVFMFCFNFKIRKNTIRNRAELAKCELISARKALRLLWPEIGRKYLVSFYLSSIIILFYAITLVK